MFVKILHLLIPVPLLLICISNIPKSAQAKQAQSSALVSEKIVAQTNLDKRKIAQISQDQTKTAEDYFQLGTQRFDQGDMKGAVEAFTQAITINPSFARAYNKRGVIRSILGEHQNAVDDQTRAVEIDPNFASAYVSRGIDRSMLRDHQGAINDYNRAIEIDPSIPQAYNSRAIDRSILGDFQGALNDYNQAIKLEPNLILPYLNRAGLRLLKLGDRMGATEDAKKAAELAKSQNNQPAYQRAMKFLNEVIPQTNSPNGVELRPTIDKPVQPAGTR